MKSFIKTSILLLLALGVAVSAQAQDPVKVLGPGFPGHELETYLQQWHRTLDADTTYVLTGFYFVDSTYSLTIPAGTTVLCAPGSALIVARGGQIFATGTASDPVVFAPTDPPGERQRGEWAGVIILGEAPVNQPNPFIEGLEGGPGYFGGTDPNDDSGDFYYVRIEYPGYRIEEGNEVNSLTMGGVGDGTEIHHVQVSYGFDDAYEFFGGTVNPHHLVSLANIDDMFDTDFGYQGNIQWGFVVRDPLEFDVEGTSNGWESDNEGSALDPPSTPRTAPIFSNITLVGPERDDTIILPPTHTFGYSAVIRRCAQNKIFNSVVMGFPFGLSIRDACTHTDAVNDVVEFAHTSIQASLEKDAPSGTIHNTSRWPGTTTPPGVDSWVLTEPGYTAAHSQPRSPSTVGLTDMSDLTNPNPVPAPGSELIGTANFTDPDLAGFDVVTYRGAFDPTKTMATEWTAGWTNFDPQNTVYWGTTDVTESIARPVSLSQNYPNPFNPVTRIAYSVRQAGNVTIKVHDAAGRVVRTLLSDVVAAGDAVVTWDGTNDSGSPCASGVYFYSIETPEYSETHKMVMLK